MLRNSHFESIDIILDAHIDRLAIDFTTLVDFWSKEEGGKKDALEFICYAVNNERADFSAYLKEYYGEREDIYDSGLLESYDFFNKVSSYCSGEIENDDVVFLDCRRINSLSDEELKGYIGSYFKSKTNEYLLRDFPEIVGVLNEKFSPNSSPKPSEENGDLSVSSYQSSARKI